MQNAALFSILFLIVFGGLLFLFFKYFFIQNHTNGKSPVITNSYIQSFENILYGISVAIDEKRLMRYLCMTYKFKREFKDNMHIDSDFDLLMDMCLAKAKKLKVDV